MTKKIHNFDGKMKQSKQGWEKLLTRGVSLLGKISVAVAKALEGVSLAAQYEMKKDAKSIFIIYPHPHIVEVIHSKDSTISQSTRGFGFSFKMGLGVIVE